MNHKHPSEIVVFQLNIRHLSLHEVIILHSTQLFLQFETYKRKCSLRHRRTLYRVKTSVVSLVASYHDRRFTTWVISVLSRGRTKCFFPRDVCRRIL